MPYTILLVDDELEMCLSLAELLRDEGYATLYATNPLDVSSLLRQEQIDLILMDVKMPEIGGIDLLKAVKKSDASIAVIMITGYPTVENAVQAMKYGALNFYTKPLKLPELLREIHELAAARLQHRSAVADPSCQLITRNPEMQKILKTIEKAAPTAAPVLITGESGTGKEVAANALHHLSPRADRPFIRVNCAALPDDLLESELFGHEKGAFTGAVKERKGRFELANTGTIFLDEIGDMSLKTQSKILRVIQEQEFERLGGTKSIHTNIRIITATNKNLKKLLAAEKFREDLYYRLSVITIHLPPLRERKDDILLLADYFIEHFNRIYKKRISGLREDVRWFFQQHEWPGNVRELRNCLERAVIFCEQDEIGVNELASQYAELIEHQPVNTYEEAFESLNREIILDALDKSHGVKKKAADILNISRRTLYNRMKKLGI
ncbi:two component, sigma54 specific, transcriptional regulator, Fis family [Candidatus Vecturithrix granuli]|uniref:Two component, sigma54 specific, transcriptional regulator, Fis family n=1 Tax=Vecturithrix granuli TaxID=1499967 RepID=A0A081C8Q8_VECG1|nr:two component, sigma54 specific, transcriptional regulator, Fis family [Candidatus Vecturithrix granuli]